MITDLIQSCLQPHYSTENQNKLLTSPGFSTLLKSILSTTKFPQKVSFDEAMEFIQMSIVDNDGIPELNEDTSTIEAAFSAWIIELLKSALTAYKNLCTPALLECTIACCQSNFNRRSLGKFICSPDLIKLIKAIVYDKFVDSEFDNSLYSSKRELELSAPGILFEKLASKSGLPDKWMKFSVRHLSGTINLWVKHRLKDAVSKGRKNNARLEDFTNDKGEESAQLGITQSTNERFELDEDKQLKEKLMVFIRNIPLIAIINTVKLMEEDKQSWILFLKLNPMNLVQWLMANPNYCNEENTFVYLAKAANLPTRTRSRWLNNVPNLNKELLESPTGHITKAKDFTLFAFEDDSMKSIKQFRALKDLTTRRETFRQRNNNTNAGLNILLILTLLTLKSPSPRGKKVLELVFESYSESADKILKNDWPLQADTLKKWAHCERNFLEAKSDLMNVIALLRYEIQFDNLSKTQQNNIKKIVRIVRNTGYVIAKNNLFSIVPR